MLDFGFYNMDCMKGMKEFPDKYFDLAIVDPPYGIDIGNKSFDVGGGVAPHKNRSAKNLTIGGVLQKQRFIQYLMILIHLMRCILKSLKEYVNKELSGEVIIL